MSEKSQIHRTNERSQNPRLYEGLEVRLPSGNLVVLVERQGRQTDWECAYVRRPGTVLLAADFLRRVLSAQAQGQR